MKFKKRIKIRNKWVGGENDPCFIIAEAGSNHNRDFKTAKKLIDIAKKAGVDAVKFQTYSAETLYPRYKEPLRLIGETEKPFDIIKKIELPRKWQKSLADYAQKKGLIFLSTPSDKQAIDELDEIVPAFKWASPELIDRPLLEYAAKKRKPLILSTGFYGIKEITEALRWIEAVKNNQVILLQCTGLYPTLSEEVNLKAMVTMKNFFNIPIGFSDHTLDTVIPAAAVALGAKMVEKHFTISRKLKGPDHPFALEPKELEEMVKNIRNIEKSMGTEKKKPVKREIEKEKLIRRGIVTIEEIKRNDKITIQNIMTKRTGNGAILPADFYKIIGKKVNKNIKADQKITKSDLI